MQNVAHELVHVSPFVLLRHAFLGTETNHHTPCRDCRTQFIIHEQVTVPTLYVTSSTFQMLLQNLLNRHEAISCSSDTVFYIATLNLSPLEVN